jgi:DNA-directed RNA polymerase beta' subunit
MAGMYLHLLSPQEFRKYCNAVIVSYVKGVVGNKMNDNLEDARFGAIGKEICGTCMLRFPLCPGHMGHIPLRYEDGANYSPGVTLDYSVYHPLYIKECAMLCRMVCIRCKQLLLDPSEIAKVVNDTVVDARVNIRFIYDRACKISQCPHCSEDRDGLIQPTYTVDPPTNTIYYQFMVQKIGVNKPSPFTTSQAYDALTTIDQNPKMRKLLGFTEFPGTNDRSSPKGMIMWLIPVLPRFMRQPFKSENGSLTPHPRVAKYQSIAKSMAVITEKLKDASDIVIRLKNTVTEKLNDVINQSAITLASTFPEEQLSQIIIEYVSNPDNLEEGSQIGASLFNILSPITDKSQRYQTIVNLIVKDPYNIVYLVWWLNPYSNDLNTLQSQLATIPLHNKQIYVASIFNKSVPAIDTRIEVPPTFSPNVYNVLSEVDITQLLGLGLRESKDLSFPPELAQEEIKMNAMPTNLRESYLLSLLSQRLQPSLITLFLKKLFQLREVEQQTYYAYVGGIIDQLPLQRKIAVLHTLLQQKLRESAGIPPVRWLTTMYRTPNNELTMYKYIVHKFDVYRSMGPSTVKRGKETKGKGKPKKEVDDDGKIPLSPNIDWISEIYNPADTTFIKKIIANKYATIRHAVVDIYTTINKKMPIQARASWMGTYKYGKKNFFRRSWLNKRIGGSARFPIGPGVDQKFGEYGIPKIVKHDLYRTEIADPGNVNRLNDLLRKKCINSVERGTMTQTLWEGNTYRPPPHNFRIQVGDKERGIPPDIVRRHLQDGDLIIVGRNPTIHHLSLRVHTVKIRDTFAGKLNLNTAPQYNADFDGDEQNVFVPDSDEAISEARKLMHVQNCLISGSTNKPAESPVIDASTGSFLMTLPDRYVSIDKLIWIALSAYERTGNIVDIQSLLERGGKYNLSYLKPKVGEYEEIVRLLSGYEFESPTLSVKNGNVETAEEINYNDWMKFVSEANPTDVEYNLGGYSVPPDYEFVSRYFKIEGDKVIQRIKAPINEALRLFKWLYNLDAAPVTALIGSLPLNFDSNSIQIRGQEVTLNDPVRYVDLQLLEDTLPGIEVIVSGSSRLMLIDLLRKHETEVSGLPIIAELTKASQNSANVTDILSRMDSFISTRTIFSIVFPSDFKYEYGGAIVSDGILRSGPLVKSIIGGTSPSIQTHILHEYGNEVMGNYIDTIESITTAYLDMTGLTLSVSSCLYGDERLQDIKERVISRMETEISQLVPPTNEVDRITYEKILSSKLGIMPQIAKKIVELLPRDHTLRAIIDAGTKGKSDIIAQMLSIIGQTYISGRRLQPQMTNNTRCHPSMVPNSTDISAHGFCKSSLMYGLSPKEYQDHSAASRPNVLDIATGTSNIGTLNRGFYMQLADVRNRHDGTIRDDAGNVIEFRYGNDNFLRGRYGKDDKENDGGGLLRMKIGEREILSFVNIPFEALNLSSYGSNIFKISSEPFNLNNISKILNYPDIRSRYLGKIDLPKILEYIATEKIPMTEQQKELLESLNNGLALEKIANQLSAANFIRSKGIELLGYKQEVSYPYLTKSGRDIILYVDPRDIPKAHNVLKQYNYTAISQL